MDCKLSRPNNGHHCRLWRQLSLIKKGRWYKPAAGTEHRQPCGRLQ